MNRVPQPKHDIRAAFRTDGRFADIQCLVVRATRVMYPGTDKNKRQRHEAVCEQTTFIIVPTPVINTSFSQNGFWVSYSFPYVPRNTKTHHIYSIHEENNVRLSRRPMDHSTSRRECGSDRKNHHGRRRQHEYRFRCCQTFRAYESDQTYPRLS